MVVNNNVANGNNAPDNQAPPQAQVQLGAASLSPTPRDLYILWQEYQHGIGHRKAARLFTAYERGRVKHKYTRRKVIWDCVNRLVNSGLMANVAIDRIYQVYGRTSTVTQIINRMRVDRNNNNLPQLIR